MGASHPYSFLSALCTPVRIYSHEGMYDTFSLVCVQNDRDSADYILGTTAQSGGAAKVAKERLLHVHVN